jgi:hypothetical protein
MYFSGLSSQFFSCPARYGLMLSYRQTGGQQTALAQGCLWMLDNGAFSGNFNEERWIGQMEKLRPYGDQCRGIIAPDAVILDAGGRFVRGDWQGTLDKLHHYSPLIRAFGYPVAYALQDNHPLERITWELFDVLFVAGSTDYKESVEAERIGKEAKGRGKLVHIGRVSSVRRLKLTWWADSWDGTTFRWDSQAKLRMFNKALPAIKDGGQWRLL